MRQDHQDGALRRFSRCEDGSMIVFTLFLLITMLIVAGMGVDFVRYEKTRARVQSTLDRAVIAASSLRQNADPEAVVRDYFRTAGLESSLQHVEVIERYNERTVSARASVGVETIFLPMVGIDLLDAPGAGSATEVKKDLEIVLVLDVSGSMAEQSRIVNLKAAATEFVDTMINSYDPGRVSIAIVPFNGQVNLGPDLISVYSRVHNQPVANADCVDLEDRAYTNRIVPLNAILAATGYADTLSSTWLGNGYTEHPAYRQPNFSNVWCLPSTVNTVHLPTTSVSDLQAHISRLVATGATSINAGMRWGTTLIDPSFRPGYDRLVASGAIESRLSGHPFDFGTPNLMKVVVVMTDGSHWPEQRVGPRYKNGFSRIYRNNADGFYSIYHPTTPGTQKYYVPHLNTWQSVPWGVSPTVGNYNPPNYVEASSTSNAEDPGGIEVVGAGGPSYPGATRQRWTDIWSTMRMTYVAWHFYARAAYSLPASPGTPRLSIYDVYNNQMNDFRRVSSTNSMDNQLQQICRQARRDGIHVYGIAFDAPPAGQVQISQCAGTPSNYYNVSAASGLNIRSAFRSIANRIKTLRLIQ